jgi:aminoglycoside phosphotransferase (APT) family kinase protein
VVRVDEALAEALPDVRPRSVRTIDDGWDSVVLEVDGEWIVRVARDEDVARLYTIEASVLRALALPLATPIPVRAGEGWILARRIPGSAYDRSVDAEPLGRFLAELHAFPVARARELGVRDHDLAADVTRFRERVLPLLEHGERAAAEQLFDEVSEAHFEPALTHGDLGPEHALVHDGRITGVIDWTDVRIADPALDLAWPLTGGAAGVERGYPVDDSLRRRALLYHALGPWHEVFHGLEHESRWIASGLAGVRERLRKVTGAPDTMAR